MIRSFVEARHVLRAFYNQPGSNTYTLDRMRTLMAYLGDPQNTLQIVHVAGTSGKTSTAYYVSALLEASGATVGLTVGPHVNEMNERVQINHAPLPEQAFCRALDEFLVLIAQSGVKPSYFELLVAFAFWQFARLGVDYAVIEVGLGGLLDGTNVITREDKVCVITDIGFDHTDILGKTLPEITTQKAGIIHEHNHVFMLTQPTEVMDVVRVTCQRKDAKLHVASERHDDGTEKLPVFQRRNFSLASRAVAYVLARDGHVALTTEQLQAASNIYIPGRMEMHHFGRKTIIIDGAHNAQKMAALTESVRTAFPNQAVAALVALVKTSSNRWQPALDVLATITSDIIVTNFQVDPENSIKQSIPPAEIAVYLHEKRISSVVEPVLKQACEQLLARPEPVLLVTGSFYVLSDARRLLGLSSKY